MLDIKLIVIANINQSIESIFFSIFKEIIKNKMAEVNKKDQLKQINSDVHPKF